MIVMKKKETSSRGVVDFISHLVKKLINILSVLIKIIVNTSALFGSEFIVKSDYIDGYKKIILILAILIVAPILIFSISKIEELILKYIE